MAKGNQAMGGIGLNNSMVGLTNCSTDREYPTRYPRGMARARAKTRPQNTLVRLAAMWSDIVLGSRGVVT